ncbi:MAG: hypothetical protein COV46_02165 [Deltaproteobacteria bacterium CG11_big_fil_rev_8_21_14_0_20_49_13]|nr:MAG: hypothetical protein COV46_02165 [Deltaproteobacteria bacterium CG11_big_fil_rev_8_21_14_0_20_49_13]
MALDFPALKTLGIRVETCDNARGSCEVTGPTGVKNTVPKNSLRLAETALRGIIGAADNVKRSAALFGSAKDKLLERATGFGNWVVKSLIPTVGIAVAADSVGRLCKPSVDACISDNKGVE